MFEVVLFFQGFNDRYGYEAWKSDLENFFSYFSPTTEENTAMPDLSWMEKLIIGEGITIDYVELIYLARRSSCSVCSTKLFI